MGWGKGGESNPLRGPSLETQADVVALAVMTAQSAQVLECGCCVPPLDR